MLHEAGTGIIDLLVDDVVGIGVANHTDTTDGLVSHINVTLVRVSS